MLSARQRPSLKQERAERRQRKKAKREEQELFEKVKKAQAAKKLDPKPSTRSVYSPSFSVMFRILTLIRVVGALTSPLQDCDEVYNYWEPLHFLSFGYGKQTWEYAEQFALRSYGFLFVYKGAISVLHFVLGFGSKVQVFYGLRILMAVMAAACEAGFARAVAVYVDRRMGNYTVLALFGMAGMYHSAVALLPTTFAMYWGMVGSAAAMVPLVDGQQRWVLWRRTVVATAAFV
ncbi:mannosyltransferase, partial [Linderina macrospora]